MMLCVTLFEKYILKNIFENAPWSIVVTLKNVSNMYSTYIICIYYIHTRYINLAIAKLNLENTWLDKQSIQYNVWTNGSKLFFSFFLTKLNSYTETIAFKF